jgi:hypothetical protein
MSASSSAMRDTVIAGWDNPPVRVAIAVLAVAVISWFAVMERDARLYDRAIAAGGRLEDPATIARAESDLRDARWLNPDRTPDLARVVVLVTTGRREVAVAVAQDLVRAEPDNVSAWDALDYANGDRDPALKRQAAAEIRRLDPLVRQGP